MARFKLKDIGTIITGNTPKTSDNRNYDSNDICFVKPSDIDDNELSDLCSSECYISEYARGKARIVPAQSVLVTCIGIIGKVGINSVDCAFNQQINAIIPNIEKCDCRYLAYAIQRERPKLQSIANAPVVPILNKSQFSDIEISLPPLAEQRKIAAVLDKVSSLIVKRKQQLDKLDELVKSRFVEMFGDPVNNERGWQKALIPEVCHAIIGGGTPSKSHPEYFTGTIPWVSPKDMKLSVLSDSIDHITEEAIANSTTKLVPANSVLMVIRSGILKHSLPVAINSVPVTINQDMKAFVPNEVVTTAFLMHYFMAIENDVLSGVRSVTADNIDFKAFQKRKMIVPPLDLQQQFATFVAQVDKSKLAIQKSLEKLEILKKALMQKYFG